MWVLSDRPVATVTLLRPQAAAVELRRSSNDLPSRVADNLYWLGRHVERADGLVRHLRTRRHAHDQRTGAFEPAGNESPGADAGRRRPARGESAQRSRGIDCRRWKSEILAAFVHESRSGTLDETLRSLYRTASLVRDRISADTWRIVNQLDLDLLVAAAGRTRSAWAIP